MHPQDMAQECAESKPVRKPSTPRPDPWYKRYPEDYRRGTRKLSLAARGAYSDILDLLYMQGGPIPDDNRWIACELHVPAWQWRRIRKELFDAGKLLLIPGGITNARAEEEIAQRSTAKSVKAPPSRLGSMTRTRGGHAADSGKDTRRTQVRTRGGLRFCTLSNEINGGHTTEPEREPDSQIADTDSNLDDRSPTTTTLRASQGELAGLNGAAYPIIKDVTAWMNAGDEPSARQWLQTVLRQYGQRAVRDAYAKLKTDLAENKRIARPLQTFVAIMQRLADKPRPSVEREESEQDRLDRINMGPDGWARYQALRQAKQSAHEVA